MRSIAYIRRRTLLSKGGSLHNYLMGPLGQCIRSLSSTFDPPVSEASRFPPRTTEQIAVSSNAGIISGDDEVARLASQKLPPLTLKDLVRFGRPPLPPQSLLASARFTREYLPIRLARRILALRNLPFIIVSNPHISSIYHNYLHSLRTVLSFPPHHPNSLVEEEKFTELLTEIVKIHSNTIPTLAKGFIECRNYISPEEVTHFLDTHLRARIATRLLAEQHIALHASSTQNSQKEYLQGHDMGASGSYIGTIDTELLPSRIIRSCSDFVGDICEIRYGIRPKLLVDGHTDVTFPYIPVHLEYIITELLKNAFRASIENTSSSESEPVVATIAGSRDSPTMSIRIRDRGGGISPDILQDIWKYSFTTFDREERGYYGTSSGAPDIGGGGMANTNMDALNIASGAGGDVSSIAGLGYGLPLSRAYAEYFGGSLSVQSCYGWGTDVYLTLKGVKI